MKNFLTYIFLAIATTGFYTELSAQTTVTFGTGTSSSATRGPFQRSSSGSSSVYSRANLVFTFAELDAAGVSSGATISQVNWDVGETNIITASGDATMNVYMKNSSKTAAASDTWTNMISGATLVGTYTFNTTNNFPGVKGFMDFVLSTNFVYTGDALEVFVDWDCSGLVPLDPAQPNLLFSDDGSLNWRYTNTTHVSLANRAGSSGPPSTISTLQSQRANTQFIYTSGGVLPPWPETSAAADLVIGQATLTDDVDQCTQNGLDGNAGIAIDIANGKMYVADEDNHRVLRYAYPPAGDQPNAEIVFGQPDFITNTEPASSSASAINLRSPSSVTVDANGNLYISDDTHRRILRFNNAHTIATNQPMADGVIGQTSFTNSGGSAADNRFGSIEGVHIGPSGSLWAADDGNHRVLRFDNPATMSNGGAADAVLGQPDFVTSGSGTTASTFNNPIGVFEDSNGTLWVADRLNFRVLRFDNASAKANGAAADGVLGQADFVTGTVAVSQGAATFDEPMDVAVDNAGRLYVIDRQNDRLTIFDDAANKVNGADADAVVGQTNFTNTGDGVSDIRLNGGQRSSITIDNTNNYLWVSDSDNARVVRFGPASPLPVELTSFSGIVTNEGNLLEWETASELNNKGFEIEKSTDTENWETISFIEGNGTSLVRNDYRYLDSEEVADIIYYRLKQIDMDGSFEYSEMIALHKEKDLTPSKIYPNPANNKLTYKGDEATLVFYDVYGNKIKQLQTRQTTEAIDINEFNSGTYILEIIKNGYTSEFIKFIKR